MEHGELSGTIFNIQKFSVHDGPGIRTTVFMKGCPLNCRWCANAEAISPEFEPGIIRDRCNRCGECEAICPEKAISFDSDGVIRFDRQRCTACGECAAVCKPGAITIYGRRVTVDEVFRDVSRDLLFYEGSGGGVTVSGGEPLRQAAFVNNLFRKCREAGISTCLDTCGYAPTDKLREVLAFTDYVLYDIKLMDENQHRQLTGVSNDLILDNARVVATSGIPVLFRIPLVAGVNDTEPNIVATAQFLKTLRDGVAVELLPYHRLGAAKYKTLDRAYLGESLKTPSPERMEAVTRIFVEHGVTCTVGG